MSKELKTLKDLKFLNELNDVNSHTLKEEGIKQIKKFKANAKKQKHKLTNKTKGKIEFIKYFFNITKKDLDAFKVEKKK